MERISLNAIMNDKKSAAPRVFTAERFAQNPIIHPGLCRSIGNNINGPSLIEVPGWLPNPLGRYYLYFGHHNGKHIRLAYADSLSGPWQVYKPGVLPLASSHFIGHLASPDVHVDNERQEIRLYYHGSDTETGGGSPQYTRLAISANGLDFEAKEEILATSYMRVFKWSDWYYALVMPGRLYRSRDGITGFEKGTSLFPATEETSKPERKVRHSAVRVIDSTLQVFHSRIGDSPESILVSEVDLSTDWTQWSASPGRKLLEPEFEYEGSQAPQLASEAGIAEEAAWQLRDPALFETGGNLYLLYSVAGEQGIALARINSGFYNR